MEAKKVKAELEARLRAERSAARETIARETTNILLHEIINETVADITLHQYR